MRMLSRVADRLFWMARYLERAEDTARLTQAYTHLIMDIPEGTQLGWEVLVKILDADPLYSARFRAFNEQNVLRFLIADADNHSSIQHSIVAARENVRTTRDVLPAEAWEQVNELYLFAQEKADKSIGRRNRHAYLDEVITRCQMIVGLLNSSLYRDHAYRFIKLGHLLERADMTSRVIDVGVGALLEDSRHRSTVDPLIWASLLQSLSAMGSYRRHIGPLVEANQVVDFVVREPGLPRSMRFCLDAVRADLQQLKNHSEPLQILDRARRKLSRFHAEKMDREQLHRFIDDIQQLLNERTASINSTWFRPSM